jgi:hypothetical protein
MLLRVSCRQQQGKQRQSDRERLAHASQPFQRGRQPFCESLAFQGECEGG